MLIKRRALPQRYPTPFEPGVMNIHKAKPYMGTCWCTCSHGNYHLPFVFFTLSTFDTGNKASKFSWIETPLSNTLVIRQCNKTQDIVRPTFDKHIWNVLSAWTWPGEWLSAGKKIIATFAFDKEFKIALKMTRTIPHFFELWKLSIRSFWLMVVSFPNRLSLYRSSSIFQQPKKK